MLVSAIIPAYIFGWGSNGGSGDYFTVTFSVQGEGGSIVTYVFSPDSPVTAPTLPDVGEPLPGAPVLPEGDEPTVTEPAVPDYWYEDGPDADESAPPDEPDEDVELPYAPVVTTPAAFSVDFTPVEMAKAVEMVDDEVTSDGSDYANQLPYVAIPGDWMNYIGAGDGAEAQESTPPVLEWEATAPEATPSDVVRVEGDDSLQVRYGAIVRIYAVPDDGFVVSGWGVLDVDGEWGYLETKGETAFEYVIITDTTIFVRFVKVSAPTMQNSSFVPTSTQLPPPQNWHFIIARYPWDIFEERFYLCSPPLEVNYGLIWPDDAPTFTISAGTTLISYLFTAFRFWEEEDWTSGNWSNYIASNVTNDGNTGYLTFDTPGHFFMDGGKDWTWFSIRVIEPPIAPPPPIQNMPIIVIPGILGSSLEHNGDIVWLHRGELPALGWSRMDRLEMNAQGRSVNTIRPRFGVYGTSEGIAALRHHHYAPYRAIMRELRNTFPDTPIHFFAYDWRECNAHTAILLSNFINNYFGNSQQVNIVAHSMGGLVAARYIVHGHGDRINQLITLGTPWLGAPKVPYIFATGNMINPFLGFHLQSRNMQRLSSHMPSAYQLLPFRSNYSHIALGTVEGRWPRSSTTNVVDVVLPEAFILNTLNMVDMRGNTVPRATRQRFLYQSNYFMNSLFLSDGRHAIETVNHHVIIGHNTPTVNRTIFARDGSYIEHITTRQGDQTVPVWSATMNGRLNTVGFNYRHTEMMHQSTVIAHVINVLNQVHITTAQEQLSSNSGIGKLRIGSPVEVIVTNGTESISSAYGELIRSTDFGSLHMIGPHETTALFIFNNDVVYDVHIVGMDYGTMDFSIYFYDAYGNLEEARAFWGVTITPETVITANTSQEQDTILNIDSNGNSVIDTILTPTDVYLANPANEIPLQNRPTIPNFPQFPQHPSLPQQPPATYTPQPTHTPPQLPLVPRQPRPATTQQTTTPDDTPPPYETTTPTTPQPQLPPPPMLTQIMRLVIGSTTFTHMGIPQTSDVAPFIDIAYDRTMVPLRIIAEGLGAPVRFDSATRTVYIALATGREISLVIDAPLPGGMGVPVIIYDRTFVPARYVSEVLGAIVRWDGSAQAVYIYR